ncbi:MAG: biotin attachment protein [Actinobacteria bacterium]|nr:biotin attachment protein [Actinomycetota bacterium]
MRTTINMPRVGDTVDEVYLVTWKKSVGEKIAKGESLMEVETDKATVEVPSPIDGTIVELLFAEGDEIKTGEPIVICENL